jgi:hypothetical protein
MDGFWVMVQMKRAKISVTLSGKEAKQVEHRSRLAPSNSKKGRSEEKHANGKT